MQTTPPNILFIMADQMTATALPFYGRSLTQTPHLSALADEGVVFANAYCNSPLCAPSRFSMMSGQLPSRIGAYDNAAYFPGDVPTIAHYLRARGYHTCLSGKMHFVGADQLHGFEERLTTDIYPSDFGWTPDWENDERPSWYHNMLSVVQAGLCTTSNQLDFDEEVAFHAVRKIYDLARREEEDKRPFFLLASFTHPHDPFAITPEYWNRYHHADIDMPAVPPIPYDQLDPHSQRLYHVSAMGDYAQTEGRVRNSRHAYYAMISYIDDKVGQLVKALHDTGQADNTVIIFVSDHGEMLGERGMWYKMSFFEGSARVPMIFHAPHHFPAGRVQQPVSLVDLLPTLVDLADNDHAPHTYTIPLDGRSLLPLLHNNQAPTNRTVYGEMLGEGAIAPLVMIRNGRYKYIYSPPDPEQLYDLAADPHELNNLAPHNDYANVRHDFYNQMQAQWDLPQIHAQVLASQQRRRLVDEALRNGRHTPWDFQPFTDASQKYMRNHLDLNVLERTARFPSPNVPEKDGVNA
ncbi:MAG: choline-sulfatase [Ardenticatenaceae bacterium]|nr:choline-sulfatase [Ardenticatenaceae bacterium]